MVTKEASTLLIYTPDYGTHTMFTTRPAIPAHQRFNRHDPFLVFVLFLRSAGDITTNEKLVEDFRAHLMSVRWTCFHSFGVVGQNK